MSSLVDPRRRPPEELWYRLAFHSVGGIGPARIRRLQRRFGSLRHAWAASPSALAEAIGDKVASRLERRDEDPVTPMLARAAACGAYLLPAGHDAYPALLAETGSPPDLLWLRGDPVALSAPSVAIVGTRRASDYGRSVTWELAEALVQQRVTVVSGLARGIDTVAHAAALDAGGTTVAVLGCGIDRCYPAGNTRLLERIIGEGGAVISELLPGAPPLASHFPARNRIVSGLALATVVVEAGARSGATITASLAANQGRDVLAVPGPIDSPTSVGANRLLADGAAVITCAQDLLDTLDLSRATARGEARTAWPMDATEQAVVEALVAADAPLTADELLVATGMRAATIGRALSMLELKGLATREGGARWRAGREGTR